MKCEVCGKGVIRCKKCKKKFRKDDLIVCAKIPIYGNKGYRSKIHHFCSTDCLYDYLAVTCEYEFSSVLGDNRKVKNGN